MTKTSDCEHEIGRPAIEHNGIAHPSGEQFCFLCKKTLKEIIFAAKKEAYAEGLKKGKSVASFNSEIKRVREEERKRVIEKMNANGLRR